MTQSQVIIKAIEELAFNRNNRFTAKHLMNYLIDKNPGTHWKRGSIASVLSFYLRDPENKLISEQSDIDGRGVIYFAKPVKQTFSPLVDSKFKVGDPKIYTIQRDTGDLSGKFHAISQLIIDLKLPMRYSQSEDKFINYTDLHINHLENIVCKDMEGMTKAEIKEYINSPIFNTYVSKK